MSERTRVGVVGAGALGYHHVRLLGAVSGAELVGFVDRDPERAARVSAELSVPAFPDVDALVAEVEALTIAVPTPAHHEVASAALARGRHVLIEKPLATTLAEADDLIALARSRGALIQTGHVERFNRAVRAAMPHISTPRFIESDRLAPFTPRGADVAVVLDLMIHDIDLVRTLVAGSVTGLAAVGVGVLTPSVDIANARIAFDDGAVANITASRISRERLRKLRIFQPNGYLSLDLAQGSGEFYRLRADVDLGALASAPRDVDAFVERIPLDAPPAEPLHLELESFIAAVQGRQPVLVTGEDGRDALDLALRIEREIERARPGMGEYRGS